MPPRGYTAAEVDARYIPGLKSPHAPIDAPMRLPIDMPDHFDADETDGDGVIRNIAICLVVVFVIAALFIFVVKP